MTPQEAKDNLMHENLILIHMYEGTQNTAEKERINRAYKTNLLAIETLELKSQLDEMGLTFEYVKALKERQIPKKPLEKHITLIDDSINFIEGIIQGVAYFCPNCKQDVRCNSNISYPSICPKCMQVLDWGDR